MKRRSPSSAARGKNRVDGVKNVLVEDLLKECARIGCRINGRNEVDVRGRFGRRLEHTHVRQHRTEAGEFRGTLKVLGSEESPRLELSRSVGSLSRNPTSVDETGSNSLTSSECQEMCRGEVPFCGDMWRSRRNLEACQDSESQPGPMLCLDEGINRILVSAVSAVSNSNTSEIQRLQVLLLQEENSILRRELAKAKREIDLKDVTIRSLEKSLKALNDLLVGLVKSGGIRLEERREERTGSSQHSYERDEVSKSNCKARSPGAADSPISLRSHQRGMDEQLKESKLVDYKNTAPPSASSLRCKTKLGEYRFANFFRCRQQGHTHLCSRVNSRTAPSMASPASLAVSSSSGNDCCSRHRLSLGDLRKPASAKSAKTVPKLESTDEVDFTISNDTVGGCGRSCVYEYYYSSDVENELASSSRGGSNANSFRNASSEHGTKGDVAATRLVTMGDFCKGGRQLPSISSPPLTPSPPDKNDLIADQSTPITDTTKASSLDACLTSPPATRLQLVPTLKLGAVGESAWMSGQHTAGETYQISYDADGERSPNRNNHSGQP